ncbi:NEDD8-conjugating enzyme Ubc12-like [Hyalella azteca]|uniref:E2 NEDD8-conjugating enzyme n=1 Tax=Hyalella azteca TaxID=294128 RepID=A0A8B7PQX7_HYAAZ|nr:NEDD8-conjugating enzyme Ubc12-like [Hyalella azteca]
MIKLFSMKNQKKDGSDAQKSGGKRASAAQLRITKDINELTLPKTCETEFPDPDNLLSFKVIICPDEGFYRSGRIMLLHVYHPNIDMEGNVCLNILREDWKPVLTINSIVYGLQYLFLEPNPEDPLNKEAAEVLRMNRPLFEQNVVKSMRGGYVSNVYFERCLK